MRTVYSRPDRPKAVVICYTGDETKAADFPQGNTRYDQRPFIRTQPHVVHLLQQASGTPNVVYRSMVTDATGLDIAQQSTAVPRNIEQVRNAAKSSRNRTRLTTDALDNLHEFAIDSNFVLYYTVYIRAQDSYTNYYAKC